MQTQKMSPRIRAKVGQVDEPGDKDHGKFVYTIWIAQMGEGTGKDATYGPYDTEAMAHEKMRAHVKHLAQHFEKMIDGKVSGQYFDFKTNELRKWDEH